MEKVLVTGADGFIGSHLIEKIVHTKMTFLYVETQIHLKILLIKKDTKI